MRGDSSTLWNAASCVNRPSLKVTRSAPVMPLPIGRVATTFAVCRNASCWSTAGGACAAAAVASPASTTHTSQGEVRMSGFDG